jgi:hypothetical protein
MFCCVWDARWHLYTERMVLRVPTRLVQTWLALQANIEPAGGRGLTVQALKARPNNWVNPARRKIAQ